MHVDVWIESSAAGLPSRDFSSCINVPLLKLEMNKEGSRFSECFYVVMTVRKSVASNLQARLSSNTKQGFCTTGRTVVSTVPEFSFSCLKKGGTAQHGGLSLGSAACEEFAGPTQALGVAPDELINVVTLHGVLQIQYGVDNLASSDTAVTANGLDCPFLQSQTGWGYFSPSVQVFAFVAGQG